MSGLASVIARVDAIESQIVSLDPVARAAAATATESTAEAGATSAASAATFSSVLEAAKAAASADTTTPVSEAGASADAATSAKNAELVSALQTLFSANTSRSAGSAASMQKLIEMLG
ncbi:hypothetical protein [Microbacterium sp. Leaf320]|uniref:hypothetical protein n=1 Tax=Microbacterium sp. Leaf320 TaxID=1736334 RepID=UPI0006F9180C|nr:hypothetical protein [Microbacterium sp. Leaf320]KQQ64745.1 hypothetical protein ASF63_17450 [Microbacterium sp. Leaf320]